MITGPMGTLDDVINQQIIQVVHYQSVQYNYTLENTQLATYISIIHYMFVSVLSLSSVADLSSAAAAGFFALLSSFD